MICPVCLKEIEIRYRRKRKYCSYRCMNMANNLLKRRELFKLSDEEIEIRNRLKKLKLIDRKYTKGINTIMSYNG